MNVTLLPTVSLPKDFLALISGRKKHLNVQTVLYATAGLFGGATWFNGKNNVFIAYGCQAY